MMPLSLYVIIVSDHNLAELRACLFYQPREVWMVVTSTMQNQARRFERELKSVLPHTITRQWGLEPDFPLQGEFFANALDWLQRIFIPPLKTHPASSQAVLNMTGGTKILALALVQAYAWHELHYQPFQKDKALLDRLRLCLPQGTLAFIGQEDLSVENVSPLTVARLYMNDIQELEANPIVHHAHSLALAEEHLAAEVNPLNYKAWTALQTALEKIWSQSQNQKHVTVARSDLLCPFDELEHLLIRLRELCPNTNVLSWTPEVVCLPTQHHKESKYWRKWVSGVWFEQLVEAWLRKGGIADKHIKAQVQLRFGEKISSTEREADILLLRKNSLHVLELKVDLPVNYRIGQFEEQLSSLADHLGKTTKILIFGPAVKRRLTPEQWDGFQRRCLQKQVRLIELNQYEDLKSLWS